MDAVIRQYQFDPKSSEEINRPISGRLRPWPPRKGQAFLWPTLWAEIPAETGDGAHPPEFSRIEPKNSRKF